MSDVNNIELLGLTELQADVILALLELGGEGTAPEIIKIISNKREKFHRTSIYPVFKKLEQMNLIRSNNQRSANYTLVTTSPKELLDRILQPHETEKDLFLDAMKEARQKKKGVIDYEFYYLQSREEIVTQVQATIQSAKDHILIMANLPFLAKIYRDIEIKLSTSDCTVLIIPTWNPSQNTETQVVLGKFTDLLGRDRISKSFGIFEDVSSVISTLLMDISEISDNMVQVGMSVEFVQIMTEDEWIMGNFLDAEPRIGSGIFSREPVLSQMLTNIFLELFKTHLDPSLHPKERILDILKAKTLASMKTMQQNYQFLNS